MQGKKYAVRAKWNKQVFIYVFCTVLKVFALIICENIVKKVSSFFNESLHLEFILNFIGPYDCHTSQGKPNRFMWWLQNCSRCLRTWTILTNSCNNLRNIVQYTKLYIVRSVWTSFSLAKGLIMAIYWALKIF